MPNIIIGQYKDLLKSYFKNEQERNAQRKRVMEMYSPDFAEGELSKLRDLSEGDHQHKKEVINRIFEKVRNSLSSASQLRNEERTSDEHWFKPDSIFRLSRKEVETYIEKYKNNPTMSRMINDWLTLQQEKAEGKSFEYAGLHATTPQDQLAVYEQFTDSALAVADRIYNGSATEWEVEGYADETFGAPLYDVIGTGMNLSNYSA